MRYHLKLNYTSVALNTHNVILKITKLSECHLIFEQSIRSRGQFILKNDEQPLGGVRQFLRIHGPQVARQHTYSYQRSDALNLRIPFRDI